VTENGVATTDDKRRVAYIDRALAGLSRAIASGVDVRDYIHWSLLDNFEWNRAYTAQFGLVSVDRQTFKRTINPAPSIWAAMPAPIGSERAFYRSLRYPTASPTSTSMAKQGQ
jgi:beta-glucosidase/6-phospho-beta-glucosidase/beta-galactosidase